MVTILLIILALMPAIIFAAIIILFIVSVPVYLITMHFEDKSR